MFWCMYTLWNAAFIVNFLLFLKVCHLKIAYINICSHLLVPMGDWFQQPPWIPEPMHTQVPQWALQNLSTGQVDRRYLRGRLPETLCFDACLVADAEPSDTEGWLELLKRVRIWVDLHSSSLCCLRVSCELVFPVLLVSIIEIILDVFFLSYSFCLTWLRAGGCVVLFSFLAACHSLAWAHSSISSVSSISAVSGFGLLPVFLQWAAVLLLTLHECVFHTLAPWYKVSRNGTTWLYHLPNLPDNVLTVLQSGCTSLPFQHQRQE